MHATTILGLSFLIGLTIARDPLPKCGPNERLEACDGCPQPSCVHQDIPNKPCILKCYRPGCVCAEGYYRDDRYGGRGGCITRRMCNGP